MSDPAFQLRIRADKTGPEPAPGQPWPMLGVEIVGGPPAKVNLPTSFLRRHRNASWLRVEGSKVVERPSRPDPGVEGGSTVVTDEHRLPADDLQPPHVFEHLDRIIFDTLDGEVVYKVDRQPDKYATNAEGVVTNDNAKVTPELYAEGRTQVDHFYGLSLVSTGKES